MQVFDLPVQPGPPHASLKRRILDELLLNPFLDEDLLGLSLRLSTPRPELSEALESLCQERFLKQASQRGYLLDLEEVGAAVEAASPAGPIAGQAAQAGTGAVCLPKVPEGLGLFFPDLGISLEDLVETLPFGVVLLRADGALELANERAAQWLGIPLQDLDGATFEMATGVNPGLVTGGATAISFFLKVPRPLELSLHTCGLAGEAAVLIVVRDAAVQEQVSRMQAQVQEQLFARIGREVVEPLGLIEQFLENPDSKALGQARAALEQINWFLQDFLLRRDAPPDGKDSPELGA